MVKQTKEEKKKETKRLLEEGYTQADIDLAERMASSYNISRLEYLHKYVRLTKAKREIVRDDSPTLQLEGNVIEKPGSMIVDIETSSITLMRCINARTDRQVTCAVLNNTYAKTSYVDASGRPVFILPDVFYNVLVQLLYTCNYRVQEAEKEKVFAQSEAKILKNTIELLQRNGIID